MIANGWNENVETLKITGDCNLIFGSQYSQFLLDPQVAFCISLEY